MTERHIDIAEDSPGGARGGLAGDRVRQHRQRMLMSQHEFAFAIRRAGHELGEPNCCTKRLVQKWESGGNGMPSIKYQRALEWITRQPIELLRKPVDLADAKRAGNELGAILNDMGDIREQLGQLVHLIAPDTGVEQRRESYRKLNPQPRMVGDRLREVRMELGWSQPELAFCVRAAGWELDEPNRCTKRLVRKWEHGVHTFPRPPIQRALELALNRPFAYLCEPAMEIDMPMVVEHLIRLASALELRFTELFALHEYLSSGLATADEPGQRRSG